MTRNIYELKPNRLMSIKQKLDVWLFPPQEQQQELETEIITNKKFILMLIVWTISLILAIIGDKII